MAADTWHESFGAQSLGNNILDSSPCGLRVDWSYVRVFSWFALQMNHENQTTKSHEPGITKRHKGSADESSMVLPLKRLPGSEATLITGLKPRCEGKNRTVATTSSARLSLARRCSHSR